MELHVLNRQLPEPPVNSHMLDVVDVFFTIQGEGPFTGDPAVFVRVAGCNCDCPNCDTNYTTGRHFCSPVDVYGDIWSAAAAKGKRPQDQLVVITGGEPFRQQIGSLVRLLCERSVKVQIETNGTLYIDDFPWYYPELSVVCSPKGGSVNSKLWPHITAYKYVLESGYVLFKDGLPLSALGNGITVARPHPGFKGVVYVNPEDQQNEISNKLNLDACVESAIKFGYRVGYQLHKLLELK